MFFPSNLDPVPGGGGLWGKKLGRGHILGSVAQITRQGYFLAIPVRFFVPFTPQNWPNAHLDLSYSLGRYLVSLLFSPGSNCPVRRLSLVAHPHMCVQT